jgi:TPR repeat protein
LGAYRLTRGGAAMTKGFGPCYVPGCSNLGALFLQGRGVSKDEARAAALFTKVCEGGEATGCFNLGVLLQAGGKDNAGAVEAYRRGCAPGDQGSCVQAQNLTPKP